MTIPFQPIKPDYRDVQHVLGSTGLAVHPVTGDAFATFIEQMSGVHQDLVIYKLAAGAGEWTEFMRWHGTIDSAAQFAFGSVGIGKGGSLIVTTSLVIPGFKNISKTGFVGGWLRVPGAQPPY